jgi:hypothetical protein
MQRVLGILGFGLLTYFCLGQETGSTPEQASVSVGASTTFGEPLAKVLVVLKAVGPTAEYRQTGGTIRFERVPFGLYDVEIQAPGFSTRRERVGIYQPEVRLWFGLVVAPLHSVERSEVVGSIAPMESDHRVLWVRLVPLYSSDFIEDQVTPAGKFHLAGLQPGKYVLLVFDKEKLIMTKPLEYSGGKLTLNLDMAK